jgi:hypothetical protein
MSLAVVGSRNLNNYELLSREIDKFLSEIKSFEIKQIVSGGAKGGDQLGEKYAKDHNLSILVLKPNWSKYGKNAGFKGNREIISQCDQIIAFWDGVSPGTKNTIDQARQANKLIKVINYDQNSIKSELDNKDKVKKVNGYQLFMKEILPQVKSMSVQPIDGTVKEVARRWKALGSIGQKQYKDQALTL